MRVVKYKTKLAEDKKAVLEKEFSINYPEMNRKMTSPELVVTFARNFLRIHEQSEEYMYMICTNTKLEMMSVFEISHGNVNSSIVSPREVYQKALLANAVCIFLMHNHPSGDCTPSREDIEITKRLSEAGKILNVQLLDHIIIGDGCFTSLKEKGYV